MNRPLCRQIKKQAALFTSAILAITSLPGHAEQRVTPGTPLYFQMRVKKGTNARVQVKDKETGKSASLVLIPSMVNPENAAGLFHLQFDNQGPNLEALDFFVNDQKMNVFSPGPNSKNVYLVYLFTNLKDKEEFSQRFAELSELELARLNKKTPTPQAQEKGQVQLPKELPKVEALQTKTVEVQKKENEIKLNLEANEAQKRAEALEQLAKMKETEKRNRKEKAKKIGDEALQNYQNAKYKEAAELFEQASELDPESDTYYFQHGVSLYKIDDYKKSLALLDIAEGPNTNKIELTYFKALNHMKLKDYDPALEEFTEVKEENDENLSPTAAFYAGNVAFRKENYAVARENLEYTIDHSKDPTIDKQAETLIEEIDRIESFLNKAKEIFRYSLTAGMGYDSNVLNMALQNVSTNAEAVRLNYGGNFLYRFLYDYQNELSAEINYNDTYSMTPSFKPDTTLQSTDPLVMSIGLPYRRQSQIGARAVSLGFTPTYQTITMNIDGKERKQILSSTIGKFDASFMRNAEWMSSYRFEYSADNSQIPASTPDDVLSGNRMTLGTTQIRLLNQRGTNTWSYSADYTLNQSQGKNYQYNKIGLGVGYTDKILKEHDGSIKFDYASQAYPQSTSNRADTLAALSASLGKEYWPSTYVSYSTQLNANSSTVPTYRYDRIVFNVSITYLGSYKKK
ncbi:MAG: hypothetical protein ACXVCY_11155 [Pseudobdellovibrionaceae bacterium]